MACFSLAWLQAILIWFVVIVAVLALLKLIVSTVTGAPLWPLVAWPPSAPAAGGFVGVIGAVLNIVIWAVLSIALIYFVFGLISCLLSFTGGLPRLH